jgi:hypothetical protein
MEFDYKKLLMAYIRHVGNAEGIDFLGNGLAAAPIDWLTLEETQEINRLSTLVDEKYKDSTYE